MKYLAVDPSGFGTTGLFLYDSDNRKEIFSKFQSKEWIEHFQFIKNFCEEHKVNVLICEFTSFIKFLKKDLLSFHKLIGSIETLPCFLSDLNEVKKVYVKEVKALYRKVLDKEISISSLIFKNGRGGGWFRKNKKISLHELDAFLIFYYYRKKIIVS